MVRCWVTKWELHWIKGLDKGRIGDKYGFLLLTPVGTSKGIDDVDTG